MKIFFSAVVIFLLKTSLFSAIKMTPEQFIERYFVEVDSCRFKFGIDYSFAESYRLKIWKEIDEQWILQNRFVLNPDRYEGFDLFDWNNDGFKDARVKFSSMGENENFLFIYDDSLKQYRNIEMYWWYSGSYGLESSVYKNKNYYYSFIAWGCEGNSWESILFTIEDFKIVVVGSMNINYCEEPYQLEIYKFPQNEDSYKLATIGMDYINNHYDRGPDSRAWMNYAVHYWLKHSDKFID